MEKDGISNNHVSGLSLRVGEGKGERTTWREKGEDAEAEEKAQRSLI